MPIPKRLIFSLLICLGLIWGNFQPQLDVVAEENTARECVMFRHYNGYPNYFLNARTGEYWRFPDGGSASDPTARVSQVSPDQRYIAYTQPTLADPWGDAWDLYVEEIATGQRHLLASNVAYNLNLEEAPFNRIIWSGDSQNILFSSSNYGNRTGFTLVTNLDGTFIRRWEGWFYSFQWSPDSQYLALANYDDAQKFSTLYVWNRATNHEISYATIPDRAIVWGSVQWSPNTDQLMLIDSDYYFDPEILSEKYRLHIMMAETGFVLTLPLNKAADFSVTKADFGVWAEWDGSADLVNTNYRAGDEYYIENIDALTGNRSAITEFTDRAKRLERQWYYENGYLYLHQAAPFYSSQFYPVQLPYQPERILNIFYQNNQAISPYWRYIQSQSAIVWWEYDQHLFATLYDFATNTPYTTELPFTHFRDLELLQVNKSELTLYRFADSIAFHEGIFDARTGQFLLEFSDEIAVPQYFNDQTGYISHGMFITSNHENIFSFSNGASVDYYKLSGEFLWRAPVNAGWYEAANQNGLAIIIDDAAMHTQSVTIFDGLTQSSQTHVLGETFPQSPNTLLWSPDGELMLIHSADYNRIFDRAGNLLRKFPPQPIEYVYYELLAEWVRCDSLDRIGTLEIIERGYAEKSAGES